MDYGTPGAIAAVGIRQKIRDGQKNPILLHILPSFLFLIFSEVGIGLLNLDVN